MTKEDLIQYCDLKKEINYLESKLNKWNSQDCTVGDVVQNGYKRHAVVFGYDYNRAYKLDLLKLKLQERYDKALQMQTEIEAYINTVDKSDIRQILEYRYIENMNWIQIQVIMGYNTESTARMKIDRFLEENL